MVIKKVLFLVENYGYARGRPCVVLKVYSVHLLKLFLLIKPCNNKVNRIYGWEPEPYYNLTEVQNLPDMPMDLKNRIGI